MMITSTSIRRDEIVIVNMPLEPADIEIIAHQTVILTAGLGTIAWRVKLDLADLRQITAALLRSARP